MRCRFILISRVKKKTLLVVANFDAVKIKFLYSSNGHTICDDILNGIATFTSCSADAHDVSNRKAHACHSAKLMLEPVSR